MIEAPKVAIKRQWLPLQHKALRSMLLNQYLPDFQFANRYSMPIKAQANSVFHAMSHADFSRSWIIRTLFFLRGMPTSSLTLDGLRRTGFVMLGETKDREYVLGLVGRFWKVHGDLERLSATEFLAFAAPGYVKAAWSFEIEPDKSGWHLLSTETRIYCTDRRSFRLFSFYWLVIGVFSGIIRKAMLRIIKHEAEEGSK